MPMNFGHAALSPEKVATSVIGVCAPGNPGSVKVTVPTPASTPTVPYVFVTRYAAPSCQGIYFIAFNLIIGACTAVPGSSDFYGIASVTGSVRNDEISKALISIFLLSQVHELPLELMQL
jgi:hypothetical protein